MQIPVVHLNPNTPSSHPNGQLPSTWWHGSPLLQLLPHDSLQSKPYVLLSHAVKIRGNYLRTFRNVILMIRMIFILFVPFGNIPLIKRGHWWRTARCMHRLGASGLEAGNAFYRVMSAACMTRNHGLHGVFPRNTPLSRLVWQVKGTKETDI